MGLNFKNIILIGDTFVGKSCILQKYICGDFDETIPTTMSFDFKSKNLGIKINIWDLPGLERFRVFTRSQFRLADSAIIVFDVLNPRSLENVKLWLEDLNKSGITNDKIYLIGNKIDSKSRVVTREIGEALALELGLKYFECSAKTGENLDLIFRTISDTFRDLNS